MPRLRPGHLLPISLRHVPRPANEVSETQYIATIHPSTASIPASVWNALAPTTNGVVDNPFLDHAFFLALEESGCASGQTGWQPQHILLADGTDTPVGLLPLFLKSHSMGEYVFDHGWANALERAGGHYYPKLQGSVPFTPATAPKLLVPSHSLEAQAALLSTAQQLAGRHDASSVHLTFVPQTEAELAGALDWHSSRRFLRASARPSVGNAATRWPMDFRSDGFQVGISRNITGTPSTRFMKTPVPGNGDGPISIAPSFRCWDNTWPIASC